MVATMQTATVAVPVSPAHIAPEASLADLQEIEQQWLQLAIQAGYTDMCWEVLKWLGVPVKTPGHHEVLVCRLGEVALIGSERYGQRIVRSYDESRNAWQVNRSVTVWLESETAEYRGLLPKAKQRGDLIAEIMYASIQVTQLAWEFASDEEPQIQPACCTFLPGQWFNAILAALSDARNKMRAQGVQTIEMERQKLLSKLLVGLEI